MIILSPIEAQAFLKAKYTKRWKGKDGKWHYEYAMPKKERAGATATSEAVMDAIQDTITANPEGTFTPATFTARHGRAATQTAFKTARHHGIIEVAYQGDRGPVYRAGKRALNLKPKPLKLVGGSKAKEEKFTPFMIAKLKAEYSKLKTVDPASPTYTKLIKKLDAMTVPQLEQLSEAKIPFVSMLARNRLPQSSWEEREKELAKEGRVKMDAPVEIKPRAFKIVNRTPKGYGPNG